VHPIELSSPDIFKRPDTLGDGGNQYVYGSQQPDGYLYVSGAITVTGGAQDDAQWLVDNNHVDLKVENSAIPHTFTHQWAVNGSAISVNTPNNGYPDYQANTWVFKGLPDDNSGFGNHEVNLYVDSSKSETAHIQTFFNATARNWVFPGEWHNDGRIPNWWYSYNAIYPQDAGYVFYEDSTSSSNTPVDKPAPHLSYITNDAYNDWNAQLYRIAPAPLLSAGYIQDAGTLQISGIHNFIWTCAHEATHRQMLDGGIDDPIFHHFGHDSDGDGLSDEWETAHHLNPNDSDTTDTYGGSSVGDTETCANIGAWGELSTMKDTWKQDWADTGLQWGDWFNYDPDVNPDAKHPYRPWQYISPGSPIFSSDPPGDVIGAMP
ncbi:MAG: thrombospondin type 3 repeat-containing protein, partial [Armatimonadota bacterium]|nr:thrombospondin type 3 repeat-containing protein [Armatimonadota bacterium]